MELLEPAGPRACIRCCQDPADCPTDKGKLPQVDYCLFSFFFEWRSFSDTDGCPAVIPGNYFDCD